MERATHKDERGRYYLTGDGIYGDRGVPERFYGDNVDAFGQIEDILGDDYGFDRLRELIEADRAGKIMILPVKPGEYAYLITLGAEIVRFRIGNIAVEEWGTSFEGCVEGFGPYRTGTNDKVFFSREAAEAALAKEVRADEHQ